MGGSMPVWGAVVLTISVAILTQFASYFIQYRQHKHDHERRRTEEWHRNLRWAVELIADNNDTSVTLGVFALDALDNNEVSDHDQHLIDAILLAIIGDDSVAPTATAGQVAAARLLVKREREGKVTGPLATTIHTLAERKQSPS
ncbi:hypothetical protein CTEST_03410 [Corynebacterium testudinoris]|uniref:Uncharacterized protein n=2 Tax=Corynebacterium testudinoris TaxID=136857 RepID=A0A0G3H5Y2_9CORY|nr:hypothetical protein CTEST_03410 [Corynebacterium testudinoris]